MSSTAASAANIRIEPVQVYFGRYQQQTVTCTADISGSHNNDYFVLYNALNATKYHVWANVNSAGSDPAPSASTAIPVLLATNATATTVAAAIAAAIDSVQGFSATSNGAVVTINNTKPGLSTTVASGAGYASFVYALVTAGDYVDLGYCDGDISLKLDEKLLDITAHQTGVDPLTSLRQGKTAEISMTLKETDIDNIQMVLKQAGNMMTPSGGTEVVAWGAATNAQNVISKAGKLVLHPVTAASASDYSRDWAFWKAHLKADSVKFSGDKEMLVSVTFKCYSADDIIPTANLFVFGDHTQNFDDQ